MICRFCGKKTESVLECPYCSHEAPVILSYRSYSSDPIIDKISSVSLTPTQKDETTSNSSHEPILLDAESALQMLQNNPATLEETTEITAQSVPVVDIDKEETELKHDDDSPATETSDSVPDEQPTASDTSKLDNNDDVPQLEEESIKVEADKSKVDEAQNSESSNVILKSRLFVQKHLLSVCAILVCVSLVIGFAIGYSVGKHNQNNGIPAESGIEDDTTSTIKSEKTTNSTNEPHSTTSNTDAHITTEATETDNATTESITDTGSDYGVRYGVLREKESEEIQ